MSTKSLNQEVLNNRFMLSFKMFYGKYQYIVENYWQVSSNSKVAIVSLVCLKMALHTILYLDDALIEVILHMKNPVSRR